MGEARGTPMKWPKPPPRRFHVELPSAAPTASSIANQKSQIANRKSPPSLPVNRFDPQILHLLVQRVAVDPQKVRGLGLHVRAFAQCLLDQGTLDLIDDE